LYVTANAANTTISATTGITNNASTVRNSGGGNGHNNMQPYLVATHIIRAK
jgi:microcystin-dependent protein